MEAEESREHLEDTAIPDLDNGLADARAALLAEAHAAIDEMAETVAADLHEFNQDLPVEIRPAMRGLPAVTERAAALVVGPADFHVGRFDEWDPNPPHAEGGLYIVYYYRGAKVVQSILDTYPMGFPAAAAQQQVDRGIGALLAMGPEEEALSDLLLPYALVMSDLADAGLHDVAVDRFSEFVSALQEQGLRHGAMLEVLAAVAGDEPDVSEYLMRDSDFDIEFATVSILLGEIRAADSPTRPLNAFTRPLTRTGMKKSDTSRQWTCWSSVTKTPTGTGRIAAIRR